MSYDECVVVRGVVTDNYMQSESYKLGRAAGVFLQGFQLPSDDGKNDGYVMVEFWCRDQKAIGEFVSHLETRLQQHAG